METWLNYKPLTLLLGRKDILAYCLFESMLLTSSSVFGVMLDFGGRPRAFFTIPELMILTTPDPRFYLDKNNISFHELLQFSKNINETFYN